MPSRKRETRVGPAFITKIDAGLGLVEAIVNVFGIVDRGEDLIVSGAAAKTISERGRKIRVLNSHDSADVLNVIGVCLAIREIGREELPNDILVQYPEATGGLWTQTQYLLDTEEGLGVFNRIKAGAIDEYSIGFECLQFEMRPLGEDYVRVIKEIRLWEYSPVVWGMNQATMTTSIKSRSEGLNEQITQLADHISREHKAGRVLNASNAEKLRVSCRHLMDVLDSAGISLDETPLDSADTVEEEGSKAHLAGPQSETPPAPTPIRDSVTEAKRQDLLKKLAKH